jgi:hypothetical protein
MIAKLLYLLGTVFGVLGMSTVGGWVNQAASMQDYTNGGGVSTFSLGTGVSTATLVSGTPGRLQAVLVTTSAAEAWTFYDSTSLTGYAKGAIVGYVPASQAAGSILRFQMPVQNGIVAVPAGAGAGLTVSFN